MKVKLVNLKSWVLCGSFQTSPCLPFMLGKEWISSSVLRQHTQEDRIANILLLLGSKVTSCYISYSLKWTWTVAGKKANFFAWSRIQAQHLLDIWVCYCASILNDTNANLQCLFNDKISFIIAVLLLHH